MVWGIFLGFRVSFQERLKPTRHPDHNAIIEVADQGDLEEELRSSLFERHPSGMRLNQSGELLYNHIRATMFDFDRVRGGISELRGKITGEVRITTLGSLVVDFLPTAIEAFASQYPSVRYEVRESLAVEVIDQILSAEADIGFGFAQLVRGALDVVEEFRHPVGVILSPQHPLAQEQSIPRSACIEFPIVTHTGSFATLRAIQPMLAAENTRLP